MRWKLVVNNTPFVLVRSPETRFLMPDETGKSAPVLLGGQEVHVFWFTPLTPLHLTPFYFFQFSLKGYELTRNRKHETYHGTASGKQVNLQAPFQVSDLDWPSPLLGAPVTKVQSQNAINRLRKQAREEYLRASKSGE